MPSQTAYSVEDLKRRVTENPLQPIIEGLLHVGDVMLVHGTEECFKSVFVVQIAEAIATGTSFLRAFPTAARRVGVLETEMHPNGLGQRLLAMFPGEDTGPTNLVFFHEELLKKWRRGNLLHKFNIIEEWIIEHNVEVLIIDTVNDFFRGSANPSDEAITGEFFDRLRNVSAPARIIVRHDRKRPNDNGGGIIANTPHSNEQIRGSAEFKEDPEVILYMHREDRRTNQVWLDVGKMRYGKKPPARDIWFDAATFRLTPLPPVIAVLEGGPCTREKLVEECKARFDLGQRRVDDMKKALEPFIKEVQESRHHLYKIDYDRLESVEWGSAVLSPEALHKSAVKDMQSIVRVAKNGDSK